MKLYMYDLCLVPSSSNDKREYYYGAYSESIGVFYESITTSSGSIKYTYSYFHSVRPDYTGNSACMAYPQ